MIDDGRRREAFLEGGGVDERLERGSGLTMRLDRAVEMTLVEIAAADHRAHLAGARIEGDQGCLKNVGHRGLRIADCGLTGRLDRARRATGCERGTPLVDPLQLLADRGFGRDLHRHVERRKDAEAALIHALPAESLDELDPHLLLEVLAVRLVRAERVAEPHLHRASRLPRRAIDRAGLEHRLQDEIAPRRRALGTDASVAASATLSSDACVPK